jgi:hypothetical protein
MNVFPRDLTNYNFSARAAIKQRSSASIVVNVIDAMIV